MPNTLLSLFSQVADPRRDQRKMYPLAPVLLFTVLAMLAGARSYRQVHGFIRAHRDRLNHGFGLSLRRAPAYSSVRFILRGLDGAAMERAFRAHEQVVAVTEQRQQGVVPGPVDVDVDQRADVGDRSGVPVGLVDGRGRGVDVDNAHGRPPVVTTAADRRIGAVKSRG